MMSQASWLLLLGLVSFANSVVHSPKLKPNIPTEETFVDQCTPVPTWTMGGERVVSLVGQNITVIALLNSSRPFARQQASMLNLLRTRFYQAGFPAINFMVINSMLASENTELLKNEAPSIPVYQELPGEPVKDILGAGNDHILVLDRCGRMAYQVISPFSKLTHPYVKAAILSTYKENPCGFCNTTQNGIPTSEYDTGQTFALDEYGLVESKIKVCENHKTDIKLLPELQNNTCGTETKADESQLFQEITEERGNSLPPSFTHSKEATPGSQEILQIHNVTLNLSETVLPQIGSEPKVQETDGTENSAPLSTLDGENSTIHDEAQTTKSEDEKSGLEASLDYLGHIRNWDWSGNQNQSNMSGVSMKSTEQSVEVVYQESHAKEKRKKKKRKGKKPPANCDSLECRQTSTNDLIQNINSYEASDSSMEKLVNETQKLFDWYQQQIENGEEEYEKTNILKFKIIDHYRKLLPWLSFKLAPKLDNPQG